MRFAPDWQQRDSWLFAGHKLVQANFLTQKIPDPPDACGSFRAFKVQKMSNWQLEGKCLFPGLPRGSENLTGLDSSLICQLSLDTYRTSGKFSYNRIPKGSGYGRFPSDLLIIKCQSVPWSQKESGSLLRVSCLLYWLMVSLQVVCLLGWVHLCILRGRQIL